jgi:pyruvate/2-oxoglutarate dehydrogenase complex dihydrolipoamide dehydrogenase (E3) component
LFPLVAKRLLDVLKARKVYARWRDARPVAFDYNMVVIGAGSAGLVSAYIAAATKAKVALIEQHRMGGDCLNTGCVPSKALIRSAKLLSQIARARDFGLARADVEFSFAEVMERVQRVVSGRAARLRGRYRALGVRCIEERKDHDTVDSGVRHPRPETSRRVDRHRRRRPPSYRFRDRVSICSDTVWSLRELPRRLVVLCGGPIGCELTQAFARLGSLVTQVEMLPRLMLREDPEVSQHVLERFRREGIDVRLGHKAVRFESSNGTRRLIAEREGETVEIEFDQVLVAVGRIANTNGYGLRARNRRHATTPVETDDYLQRLPNILPAATWLTVPVHAYGRATSGMRRECSVRQVPPLQG